MAAPTRVALLPSIVVAACAVNSAKQSTIELNARAEPNGKNAIGALVDVHARGATEAWVEHGDTRAYGERTNAVPVPASGDVIVPIIGLSAAATTHYRVHVRRPNGAVAKSGDLTFATGPLPDGVPPFVRVTTPSPTVTGCVLLGLFDPAKQRTVATMIDRSGKTRWYWVAPSQGIGPAPFDRVRGNFLVLDGSADVFYELDLGSNPVKAWKDTGSPEGVDGHEFLLLPSGNALMIGWEFRKVDSRPYFAGGADNSIRADHTIDEIDPSGRPVFHWSSYDHIGLDEILVGAEFDPKNFHVVHANSLEVFPDGNLLASFRSTSSIVKIDRASGAILWRLGGKKSDFSFAGDSAGGFSRQHDPRFTQNGDLMVFDNGNQHVPRVSRVVRYRLDEGRHTATLTWEYHHAPEVFSDVAGSARELPNGHVLVGFSNGLVTEVDAEKRVVWEADAQPFQIYRAIYIPSMYP